MTVSGIQIAVWKWNKKPWTNDHAMQFRVTSDVVFEILCKTAVGHVLVQLMCKQLGIVARGVSATAQIHELCGVSGSPCSGTRKVVCDVLVENVVVSTSGFE